MNVIERWSLPEPNSGCWLWTGGLLSGYGRVRMKHPRRMVMAHRASYEIHVGPIPDNLRVCHKCDVRCCVNPEHLFLGTQQENMLDCSAKGRIASKERSGKARLTVEKVAAIRADHRLQREIAADYGVSKSTIWYVKSGRGWR